MKRIVSLVLAFSMVLALCVTSFASVTLTDVDGTEYEAAVKALIELGVVTGYPNGTYEPAKEVNRAELAKMLVVCMGLEEDVATAENQVIFNDEALKDGGSFKWSRGYVNVAAGAGVIKGYPEGDFKPEKTVTYAEALTMMLRALGYGEVIEAEGVWPSNATSKAKELGLVKNVSFGNNNDGATRGDIAILLWNMLRAPMWKINSESQGTGMNKTYGSIMLNVKFSDYAYEKLLFGGYDIVAGDETADVEITLNDVDKDIYGTYKYAGNNFYTFVEGTTVEVLINTEKKELLTIVPTDDDKLVEGKSYDLEEDDYKVIKGADYSYLRVKGRKNVLASSEYRIDSKYVEKVRGGAAKDNYITIDGTKYETKDDEDRLVIVNGERATMKDVKVGDILTKVTPVIETETGVIDGSEVFYIVESSEVEGKLTRYVVDGKQGILTVDGEKYLLDDKATCIVDAEDEDSKSMEFTGAKAKALYSDFRNEEVRLLNDAFGFTVRVEFGDLSKKEDTTYGFFKIVKYNKSDDSIVLENEDGENEYNMNLDDDNVEMPAILSLTSSVAKNFVVFVEFNSSNEVIDIVPVASKEDANADKRYDAYRVTESGFGIYDETKDKYTVAKLDNAGYNEKLEALYTDSTSYAYVGDVVVVRLLTETDTSTKRTTFACEFVEDRDELKVLDGTKDAYVVLDNEATEDEGSKVIKYVFVFDDKTNSDMTFAKLAEVDGTNELANNEIALVLEDGTEVVYLDVAKVLKATRDAFLAFTTKENKDGELELTAKGLVMTLAHLNINTEDHGYVVSTSASKGTVTVGNIDTKKTGTRISKEFKLTADAIKADLNIDVDDYRIVVLNVVEDDDDEAPAGQYVINSFEEITFENLDIDEGDRISIDPVAKAAYIIKGMDELCDCKSSVDENNDKYCDECDGFVNSSRN